MTESKLKTLITEACDLDRQRVELEALLDEKRKLIVLEATGRPDEHTTTDGGGTSWTHDGADGNVVRVTFSGPKLKSTIDPEKPAAVKLLVRVDEVPGSRDVLFVPEIKYRLVENFRDAVRDRYKPGAAAAIIRACETSGSTSVSFETKQPTP